MSSSFTALYLIVIIHLGGTEQWEMSEKQTWVEHLRIHVLNTTAEIITTMTRLYTGAMAWGINNTNMNELIC